MSLVVLCGLHRGATVALGPDAVSIGGAADADYRLHDAGCRNALARVSRMPETGAFTVEAGSDGVVCGGKTLAKGGYTELRDGSLLRVGSVSLALGESLAEAEERLRLVARHRTIFRWSSVAALVLGIWGLAGLAGGFAGPAGKSGHEFASGTAELESDSQALQALRGRIRQDGLSGLSLGQSGEGGPIRATGRLSPEEAEIWREIAEWFDGGFGARYVLTSDIEIGDKRLVLPFDIRSIASAPRPRVTLHDGNSYAPGSALPGGWTIDRISRGEIELSRGGESLVITY